MKIAFIVRATLFNVQGGDTIQVLNTAEYLRKKGVDVDIKLTTDLIAYNSYDLLHFFNIIRPADILIHIEASQKPFVVSTVFVEYAEFEKNYRRGISGFLFRFLPADTIEYVKVIARAIRSHEKISSKKYLWLGQRGSIKKIVKQSAWLLPNSESEYRRLVDRFHVEKDHTVVPYAVDETIFKLPAAVNKNEQMVLCVARIEGRKNQLNLIKAMNGTGFQLYLVGNPAPHHMDYFHECQKQAGDNIHFVSQVSQAELVEYYSKAKVHVLPSWFETAGLSSLEAAAMGCNVVITRKGDANEYFGEEAEYCDPASPSSIRKAIERAASSEPNLLLQQKIYSDFTWSKAASRTFEAYTAVLNLCESQS